jgi:hypothetical protein
MLTQNWTCEWPSTQNCYKKSLNWPQGWVSTCSQRTWPVNGWVTKLVVRNHLVNHKAEIAHAHTKIDPQMAKHLKLLQEFTQSATRLKEHMLKQDLTHKWLSVPKIVAKITLLVTRSREQMLTQNSTYEWPSIQNCCKKSISWPQG